MFADIDECKNQNQYPCLGICSNTKGSYSCSCPAGTQSVNPKISTCTPGAASQRAKLIGTFLILQKVTWISHSDDAADMSRH